MSDSTRRQFLKASTSAAMGAALAGSLSSRAYAASEDTIRVGLVGCGGRGSGAASQALLAPGNVKLVAMADTFRDQLDASLKRIEAKTAGDESAVVEVSEERKQVGFDAYKQLIDSDDIDLVVLATPPGFRPIHFEYAVGAGKNVFMEKPVAVDALGVRQVLEASRKAKEQNLKVGVGLQRRHKGSYLEMVDRIHNGAVGDIAAMRVYWNSRGVWEPRRSREEVATEMEYQMRNWYYYNWLCGDHICEQHIHNLDVGCWLKGQYPVKAIGMGGREVRTDKRYGEIFDHHAVQYTFEDGSVMISECRHIPNCWGSVTEHVHGTKGLADLTNNKTMKYTTAGGDEWEYYSGDRANRRKWTEPDPYQVEHDDLNTAIRNDIAYNEADYGAKSTMTAILGRMCTYSGKEIAWEDAIASEVAIRPENYAWDAMPPTVPNENGEYPIPVPGVTKVL